MMLRQYEPVEKVKAYDPDADEALINRAYFFSVQKHAQLELGIAFEEGRGVERDVACAAALYVRAARAAHKPVYIYSPPLGPDVPGRVIAAKGGVGAFGLREASVRLAALLQRLGAER